MNQLFPAIKDSETNSKFLTIAFLKHFLRYPPPEILDLTEKETSFRLGAHHSFSLLTYSRNDFFELISFDESS